MTGAPTRAFFRSEKTTTTEDEEQDVGAFSRRESLSAMEEQETQIYDLARE